MNPNDRAITRFTMLAHALFHIYELSIPVFVGAWLGEFDVTPAILGIIVAIGYALVGLGALPGGVLVDTYGSRRFVVAAVLGMGGGFAVVAVAPTLFVIAVALILWGAAASMYHPAALALLSRGVEARGRGFAYHGAAGNVGTVIGPLGAAIGLTFLNWRTVAALLVLPALAATAFAVRLSFDETATINDPNPTDDVDSVDKGGLKGFVQSGQMLVTGGFTVVFAVIICYGLYYRGVFTFLPDVLDGMPVLAPIEVFGTSLSPARYVYAGLLLVGVAGQYVGGRLVETHDTVRLLTASFLILVLVSVAFIPSSNVGPIPLLVVCGFLGFFVYVVAPIYQATVAEFVSSDIHGFSYGVTYLGLFGVGALGAVAAGSVLTWAMPLTLFLLLGGIAALAAIFTVVLQIRYH
jgi:MFS family permease